ncbi:MAG: YkvA family protein [Rhizobiaceae bacterium]
MANTIDHGDDNARTVKRDFWRTVKRAARQVPFMDEVVAAYYCAFDSATPATARAMLLGALAYFVMPFDVVPDLIVAVGFTDDVAVLTLALATLRRHITPAHREAARKALAEQD